MIFWCWVIHTNICDVKSDGFWLCLEIDAFDLLTWYVIMQVNSPATDPSLPPACWGMGIVGGGMIWPKVGQATGSSAFNLSHISEGCWYGNPSILPVPVEEEATVVVPWRQLLICWSECGALLFGRLCAGSVLVFSCVRSACWLPAPMKPIEVTFF